MAAVGVLAVALLIGAVAWIRSTPIGPTDVQAVAIVPADPADPAGTAPIGSGDLPHAGLVAERTAAMRTAVDEPAVGPAERDDAPPTSAFPLRSGCAERNALLPRDLLPVTFRTGAPECRVARGILDDPYLGRSVPYTDARADRVGVDRIIPLAYAWQHGAAGWTQAQREAFAHDRRNLLVVDARQIAAKADRGPAGWLPPNVALRCAYVARFAEIAADHGLTVTAEDRDVARRQCADA